MSLPKKQLRIPVSLITGHCCLNKHLHRMGLTTSSSVCASCQLEEETALHFVCVCPTLATLRTRMRTPVILLFAFQNGRLETHLWHNSLKYVRRLLNYDSSIKVLFGLFVFIFDLFPSYFSFHLGEHIRPKQRPACRSSALVTSGSTLLNPSIQRVFRGFYLDFFLFCSVFW
jgi:hypothetical protein